MSNKSHYGSTNPAYRHGHTVDGVATPEFTAWANIIQRCTNPRAHNYAFYGGRGIRIAEEWRDDFRSFLSHIGARPSERHTVDRIDRNGNYEPGNVRWATMREQSRNTSRNHLITFQGQTACAAEWAERTGLDQIMIIKRIRRGWSPERALTEPSRPRRRPTPPPSSERDP